MIPRRQYPDPVMRDVQRAVAFCLGRRMRHADVRHALCRLYQGPDRAALALIVDAIERRGMFPVHVARTIARLKSALDAGATWSRIA